MKLVVFRIADEANLRVTAGVACPKEDASGMAFHARSLVLNLVTAIASGTVMWAEIGEQLLVYFGLAPSVAMNGELPATRDANFFGVPKCKVRWGQFQRQA